ncbi:hypothetical protein Ahy_A07g031137 [Arachis hypogaea]|uniref:CCDC22 coiled-coil domain-containing protein n=1 Tax=Arachis hypogaea TaxID=3818 RepID=A0A445C305_ARAHY|nr:hypothetical protein Ahy_A07g031137 [Arachis hypogaea]
MDVTPASGESSSSMVDGCSRDEENCILNEVDSVEVPDNGRVSFGNEESGPHVKDGGDMNVLKQKEKALIDDVASRISELELLERELEVMTSVSEMAFDKQHSVDFYANQLNEQLQAKRHNLLKLESEWDPVRKSLEEKKRSLEDSLYSSNPDLQEMLEKLRECQQEEQLILSEIRKREEEQSKLSADLAKQPKSSSRKSYTEKIKEITKNSRKQDADIERILKETREVQLDSNSIQERLHRTYAVADEIVFRYEHLIIACVSKHPHREAKKDATGRQIYRLLTSIHQGFEQISQKIMATDRIRREVAEYEMKLAAMTPRSLDANKLHADADIDVVVKENDYFEHPFQEK